MSLAPVTESIRSLIIAAQARKASPDEPLRWSRHSLPIRPREDGVLMFHIDGKDQFTVDRVHGSVDDAIAWVNGGPPDELRILTALCQRGIWTVAASHIYQRIYRPVDGAIVGPKVEAVFNPCPEDLPEEMRTPGWKP